MLTTDKIALPWVAWPLAVAAGVAVAGGSLSYAPHGRINILWVWLIWAGLPLVGTVVSLVFACVGTSRPWLFQWRGRSSHWYPSRRQRLHMLWLMQVFWCLVALGILIGYCALLLFSDLAFGWSSTLVQEPAAATRFASALAWPWQHLWAEAVPSAELIRATQFQRINPMGTGTAMAGDWWRFLMASLLFYNLLPRLLLSLGFYLPWRWQSQSQSRLDIRRAAPMAKPKVKRAGTSRKARSADWQTAPHLHWELDGETESFGLGSWSQDEQRLTHILASKPQRLLWRVKAVRSPVAELSDLVERARQHGVREQALWALQDDHTEPARHIASWRAFARQHHLVWIDDE